MGVLKDLLGSVASLSLVAALGCGPEGELDPAPAPELSAPADPRAGEELVGGSVTFLRPEIGRLSFSFGRSCSGTLVEPRLVLTAAHCIDFMNGPIFGNFVVTSPTGSLTNFPFDRGYTFGRTTGDQDVALVRLMSPVPASVATPALIAPSWPGLGNRQTMWGYGCQDRSFRNSPPVKTFFTSDSGWPTSSICRGDSGGPAVWFGPMEGGPIYAVNSGFSLDTGYDVFGNAAYAIPGVPATARLSNTGVTNNPITHFNAWATTPGVKALSGDFNGDGRGDIALLGPSNWTTVPVALGDGNGSFSITNEQFQTFPALAAQPSVQAVAGDFNGDGRTDIALAGGGSWTSVPVAFSQGGGRFFMENRTATDFAIMSRGPGAKFLSGDFNGDGRADIALTGSWTFPGVVVGFSNGNGSFAFTLHTNTAFANLATQASKPVVGDFNGDGRSDIALLGGSGWNTVPVAFSNGNGAFTNSNRTVTAVPQWANAASKVLAGDFDGDGRADLALLGVGGTPTPTLAFGFSIGDGNFIAGRLPLDNFPDWASVAPFALAGRFDTDSQADIALTGAVGWGTLPVAFMKR